MKLYDYCKDLLPTHEDYDLDFTKRLLECAESCAFLQDGKDSYDAYSTIMEDMVLIPDIPKIKDRMKRYWDMCGKKDSLLSMCSHLIPDNEDKALVQALLNDADLTARAGEAEFETYEAYLTVLKEYVFLEHIDELEKIMLDYYRSKNG